MPVMETADELIRRQLPSLVKANGNTNQSSCPGSISTQFFPEWDTFFAEVLSTYNELDLSGLVSITDDQDLGEHFAIGCKPGLTTRFAKHLCDAVSKVMSVVPSLSHLTFGTYKAAVPTDSKKVPDIVLLSTPDWRVVIVGELKTYWTVSLQNYSVSDGPGALIPLQPHLAQIVEYMELHERKYAFLSTYEYTVFIRRTEDFRFEMSLPVHEKSTNPSLRQCFLSFVSWAAQDGRYTVTRDFSTEKLRAPAQPYLQASTRPTLGRHHIATSGDFSIGTNTVLFGTEGIARTWINCGELIRSSDEKAVYEAVWDGKPAIVKCYGPSRFMSYAEEASTYERLTQQRPNGFEFFPSLYTHGPIVCSSLFPEGYILVISKVPGTLLDAQWNRISDTEKLHVKWQMRKAVQVLRNVGSVCVDAGKHNVLYAPATGCVTMIDFEAMQAVDWTVTAEVPELLAIFGREPIGGSERRLSGG